MAQTPDLEARLGVAVHEVPARGGLSAQQVGTLLRPINAARVLEANGHSHVAQQDIRAHLIRVLGFGGFDVEVRETECLFTQKGVGQKGSQTWETWTVGYRALVRLTIRNPLGEMVAFYDDGSTATASNQRSLGDAHDLAYKSAISLSLKRAATSLGDQFGLSLYNRGQLDALVRQTLVSGYGVPEKPEDRTAPDLQEGVPQQVALGNDEADIPLDGTDPAASYADAPDPVVDEGTGEVRDEAWYMAKVEKETDVDALRTLWESALTDGVLTQPLKSAILEKKQVLDHEAAEAAKAPAPTPEEPSEDAPMATAPDEPAAAKKGSKK
jgi:hypothetical protein